MSEASKARKTPACPICGKPVVAEHRPFCSARCRQVDLNRWLGEVYRVPADSTNPSPEAGDESERN